MKLEEDDGNEDDDDGDDDDDEEEEEEELPRIELQQMTQSVRGSSTISYVFLRKGAVPLLVELSRETMAPLSLFPKAISVVSLTISSSP